MAFLRLARVLAKVEHRAQEALRRHGLSHAQFDVLAHVGAAEGISQQALANSLLVTKGNVCQLLDRMEAQGLLERRPEGRSNRLFLTDHGHAIYDVVIPAHEAEVSAQFGALAPSEQEQLLTLLRRVDHSLAATRA